MVKDELLEALRGYSKEEIIDLWESLRPKLFERTVKMSFRCAGTISWETHPVLFEDDTTITLGYVFDERPFKFDKKTGKCLNDLVMFGSERRIDISTI